MEPSTRSAERAPVSRLFLAVRPPEDVLRGLADLPRSDEPGVRWVPPDQWHVTVRFLGQMSGSGAGVDEAVAALDSLVWPPEIQGPVGGPVGGPAGRRAEAVVGPRVSRLGRTVICLPVAGLDDLAAAVAAATAGIGERVDPRGFSGHLTLGRLRHRGACRLTGHPFSAQFPIHEVELVQSTLGSGGALHQVIHRRSVPR